MIQKSILYMIEAKSCHRICKAFAGDPFITEEQDHPFYHVDHFLFCSENLIQYPSFGGFLAPSPAYVYFVADQGFRYRARNDCTALDQSEASRLSRLRF